MRDNSRRDLNSASVIPNDYATRGYVRKDNSRRKAVIRLTKELRLLATTVSSDACKWELSRHLRAWRKHRQFTLSELATQIGSVVSTISGWETGRRAVDLDDLAKIALAYGIHPAALLFSPDEAEDKVERMRAASALAEKMEAGAADAWIAMGRRLNGQ